MFNETNHHLDSSELHDSSTPNMPKKNSTLDAAIDKAQEKLISLQDKEGFWVFELEADCTIPAEYIMMMHYLDDINLELQEKLAVYLRSHQSKQGHYSLFTGGEGDISCSIKVYYALKMAGDSIEAPHMTRLREYILGQGGAAKANVFTRIALATFE